MATPAARSDDPSPSPSTTTTSTLYVSPGGNDTDDGTEDRPLRSPQRAADLATAGTLVRVAPGDYGPVVSEHSGTAAERIVFESTTPHAARIVTGDGTTPWTNRGDYVDIVGFEVSAPHSREGIVSEASHVRVIGDHVHDTATEIPCTGNGGAGINHAGYRDTGNEVIGTLVHDIGPAGCDHVHGIYLSQSAGKIQNNIVYRVAAWGIHTWHAATGVTITNNLVFAAGTRANGAGGGIVVGAGDNPPGVYASDFLVANNIVIDSVRGITETGRLGSGNRYLNNLLDGNRSNLQLVNGERAGTIIADPQLVDYRADGSGDYHPRAGSPAVDAATATGAPTNDRDGVTRPQRRGPDIGPYER